MGKMPKISVGMSFTVNNIDKVIQYGKIDARIDDIDLEIPLDSQLENFEKVTDVVFDRLRKILFDRVNRSLNQ